MGQAGPAIQADLGLTNRQLGYALMAFTVAYALFEVPTGRLGDRIGPRAVLTRVVVWRSAFTALTGACAGLVSLVVVRFLFGAGEAGAYPNTARVLSRWFPAAERGRVTGLMLTCAQLGGAAALALTAALIWLVGWRWAFVAFGLVGFAWAAGFRQWFRDDPADHPKVNAAELALIRAGTAAGRPHGRIPWRAVARCPGVWRLGGIIMCSS
ncbi:MAG TPA: MFS transporter, partial [Gemmataceae bacterium]|nr:MFS transporter [Gemmataceae bacterium]